MATNHGVGGSNPSSPTTGPKGKGLSLWVMIGIAAAKLLNSGNGMAFFYLSVSSVLLHIVHPAEISIFVFDSP